MAPGAPAFTRSCKARCNAGARACREREGVVSPAAAAGATSSAPTTNHTAALAGVRRATALPRASADMAALLVAFDTTPTPPSAQPPAPEYLAGSTGTTGEAAGRPATVADGWS